MMTIKNTSKIIDVLYSSIQNIRLEREKNKFTFKSSKFIFFESHM